MMIIVISSITGAALVAPVSVLAISAGGIQSTIASIILSLMLQAGVAPVNQSYLTALNTSYGYTIETAISEGLLTESAGTLVDTGLSSAIESATAYTDLGLSEIFTTTATDAGVVAGSGAVNIANTAIHVGTAGTIGAFAGAVAVGVGAGVLINHLRNVIGNYIRYGFPFSSNELSEVINNIPSGYNRIQYSIREYGGSEYVNIFYTNNNLICVGYHPNNDSNSYQSIIMAKDNSNPIISFRAYINKTLTNEQNNIIQSTGPGFNYFNGNKLLSYKTDFLADNYTDARNIVNQFQNGNVELDNIVSPDIIGINGNQQYDSDNDSYPGIANQLGEGEDMTPVNMNDYQTFADSANANTNNGNTGQDNADLFNDLIDTLIVDVPTIPDEPIIPDSPVDVPVVPDRPVLPEQPTIPNKPDVTQEDIDEALEGVTTIDLRSVFPFCIPFDLYNIILIFDTGENRRAPHITFVFPLTDWEIDVDLAVFDPVAGILRVLELILFIIGLAVATRSLIGAGG